jgi:hypothetical protein
VGQPAHFYGTACADTGMVVVVGADRGPLMKGGLIAPL